MKIELTKEQYKTLVEMLYLGNWIANATRTGADDDPLISKYDEFKEFILTFADDFLSEDFVLKEGDEFFTTFKFDEAMMPLIEHYDREVVIDQLPIDLGTRDWLRELGPVRELTEEHIERKNDLISKYEDEIYKNGLKNVVVKNVK